MSFFFSAGLRGSAIPDSVVDNFEDVDAGPYGDGETVEDYYGADTGSASRQTSTVWEGTTALSISTSSDTERAISSTSGLPRYPEQGESFAANVRVSRSNTYPEILWATQSADNTPGGYAARYDTGKSDELVIRRYDGSGDATNLDSVDVGEHVDEWMRLEVDWGTDGSMTARIYDSADSQLGSVSATDTTYSEGGIGFQHFTSRADGSTSYFDDYRIL